MWLSKKEKYAIEQAKRGLVRSDIAEEINLVLKGKISNPLHYFKTVHVVDDEYDGTEDRSFSFRFCADNPLNVLAAVLSKKFRSPVWLIIFGYYLYANEKPAVRDKWMKLIIQRISNRSKASKKS